MDTEYNPTFGVWQPTLLSDFALYLGSSMSTGHKPPGQMRQVLADNLKRELERAFPGSPNLPESFQRRTGFPKETLRRLLNADKAPTLDTMEAIADRLSIQTYKLLVPSERMTRKFQPEETTIITQAPVFEDRPAVLHSKDIEDAIALRRRRRAHKKRREA
jgi:hypothetical protein